MSKLPENIQAVVDNMTPFQRKYCEYRAKGLKQGVAAEKAGSTAQDKAGLSRTGWQVEQLDGSKDYIAWLQQERAKVAMLDEVEIIQKLRAVYDQAMTIDKLKEANTSVELMGKLIGLFGTKEISVKKDEEQSTNVKNDVQAFKDEGDEVNPTEVRIAKLRDMLKDVNSTK